MKLWKYYHQAQDPLYKLLSTAERLCASASSQDIPKISDNKENSSLLPASTPRGNSNLCALWSPDSPSTAGSSPPPSGGPFRLAALPKQWTRENFMAWLKTGRIKASFLRFKIRDYVEIMHKLRALDLTSENFKSQNLISAITCTISGRVLDLCLSP